MDTRTESISKLSKKFPEFVDSLKRHICDGELSEKAKDILNTAEVHLYITETEKTKDMPLKVSGAKQSFWIMENQQNWGSVCDKQDVEKIVQEEMGDGWLCQAEEAENKIKYSSDLYMTGSYSLIVCISVQISSSIFARIVMKVLAMCLIKFITDLTGIDTISEDQWDKFCRQNKYRFMDWYIEALAELYIIPDLETIKQISYESYERRSADATMYLIEEEKLNNLCEEGGIIRWSDEYANPCTFNDLYSVRKMLETCKTGARSLLASFEKNPKILGVVTEEFLNRNLGNEKSTFFVFSGRGEWNLVYGGETVLLYKAGNFFLEDKHAAKNLETEFCSNCTADYEIFRPILERLRDYQEHGALMIIGDDAKKEARRLCALVDRGIMIQPLDLKDEKNITLVDGIASIDGALLVDPKGICYAYGVILDGEAVVTGDRGRGSRYNSSYNYIHLDKSKNRYAVVVSEDKEKGIGIYKPTETIQMITK